MVITSSSKTSTIIVHAQFRYGLFAGTTYGEDGQSIPTLYSTIPCPENEPEIRVIVKVPPANHAYNAVLYVDGEMASSKCRSEGAASKIVINSVRGKLETFLVQNLNLKSPQMKRDP